MSGTVRRQTRNATHGSLVRQPVRTDDLQSPLSMTFQTITPDGGSNPSAGFGNALPIPAGATAIAVYSGDRNDSEGWMNLYIFDGSTTTKYIMRRWDMFIIPVASGSTIRVGTTSKTLSAPDVSTNQPDIVVATTVAPLSLATPSGTTGTVNADKSCPRWWSPSATHITLPSELSTFTVDADESGDRNIVIREVDSQGVYSPDRHIHVPSGLKRTVQCIGRHIAVMTLDGSTVDITAPAGSTVGGTSDILDVDLDYTSTDTVAAGDPGDFETSLAAVADNGRLLVSGNYSLTQAINATNYATASTRSVLIEGATGDPDDATLSAQVIQVVLSSSVRWVFKNLTIDVTGLTNGITLKGKVDFYNVKVVGTQTSGDKIQLPDPSPLTGFEVNFYYCQVENSTGDTISATNVNVNVIGGTWLGNGSNASDQILTPHAATRLVAYGVELGDDGSNNARLAAGDAARIYTYFCTAPSGNFTSGNGLDYGAGIGGVYFDRGVFFQHQTLSTGAIVGTVQNQVYGSGISASFTVNDPELDAAILGCRFTMAAGTLLHGPDLRSGKLDLIGSRIAVTRTNSVYALRCSQGTPTTGTVANLTNSELVQPMSTISSLAIDYDADANRTVNLKNTVVDGSANLASSGPAGSSEHTVCTKSKPSNWDTRFPDGGGGNTDAFTQTLDRDGDGTPTANGSLDDGVNPGWYGGMGYDGLPLFYSDDVQTGPIAIPKIYDDAKLFPACW